MTQQQQWWPLACSNELHREPLARRLLGLPLVLFRDRDGQARIQADRCPHRHAPLSAGRVRDGELECPYHGWRFNGDGQCTRVPGLPQQRCPRQALNRVIACHEQGGLVWACLAPEAERPVPALATMADHDVFFITSEARCGMAEAAENFLDGFHTHFVHAGWIRRDSKRQQVSATVHRLDDGIEARYSDEGRQAGLISRLLERERSTSAGRFRLPGLAEIEYRDRHGITLLISAWLTPEAEGRLRIHARVATRRGKLPAWFKACVLRRLFAVILKQDKQILEQTAANVSAFAALDMRATALDTPLDLLGPSIRSLLAGTALPPLPAAPFTLQL